MKKTTLNMILIALILMSLFTFASLIYRTLLHANQLNINIIDYIRYLMNLGLDKWGQSGDYLGGILNPIIGLVGSFLLYETYTITKIQISTAEHDEQKRKVESIFFNLLKQHDNITNQLELNCQDLQYDIPATQGRYFKNIVNARKRSVFKVICEIFFMPICLPATHQPLKPIK